MPTAFRNKALGLDRHDLPRVNFPHGLNPDAGCAKLKWSPGKKMRCDLGKKSKATVHISQDPMPAQSLPFTFARVAPKTRRRSSHQLLPRRCLRSLAKNQN